MVAGVVGAIAALAILIGVPFVLPYERWWIGIEFLVFSIFAAVGGTGRASSHSLVRLRTAYASETHSTVA